jgi:hypothetical protein
MKEITWLFKSELIGSGKPPYEFTVTMPAEDAETPEQAVAVYIENHVRNGMGRLPKKVRLTAVRAQ